MCIHKPKEGRTSPLQTDHSSYQFDSDFDSFNWFSPVAPAIIPRRLPPDVRPAPRPHAHPTVSAGAEVAGNSPPCGRGGAAPHSHLRALMPTRSTAGRACCSEMATTEARRGARTSNSEMCLQLHSVSTCNLPRRTVDARSAPAGRHRRPSRLHPSPLPTPVQPVHLLLHPCVRIRFFFLFVNTRACLVRV